LSNTVLDLTNTPNQKIDEFELIDAGNWAIGYRTKNSPHGNNNEDYMVGQLRESHAFSTCCYTECHPGLFVCPTIEKAEEWGIKIIKVIFRPWDLHKAGEKHRVPWFIVWEDIK
jgi:hypothetical protein